MANINSLVKEIEDLFGTTAKDNVIYFNDVTCSTPIPLPVVDAVKAIAEEYPEFGVQIGTYSVKVLNQDVRPVHTEQSINNSADKNIESSKVGSIHDNYVIGRLP